MDLLLPDFPAGDPLKDTLDNNAILKCPAIVHHSKCAFDAQLKFSKLIGHVLKILEIVAVSCSA
jgi:hypothetical protein